MWQRDTACPLGETAVQWTASRCQRLVRPLESRLQALRKLRNQEGFPRKVPTSEKDGQAVHTPGTLDSTGGPGQTGNRRLRHTYKGRARKKLATDGAEKSVGQQSGDSPGRTWPKLLATPRRPKPAGAGLLDVPTPVLQRARTLLQISPKSAGHCDLSEYGPSQPGLGPETWRKTLLPGQLDKLRTRMSPERLRCHEQLYRDFACLIHATCPEPTAAGRKSLLAMCLRALPAHIEMVSIDELDDDDGLGNNPVQRLSTAAAYLFEYLESFGHSGPGWIHLRLAVRAYGLHILATAVSEGLVDSEVVWLMVRLGTHCGAIEECEGLLDAMLGQDAFPPPRSLASDWTEDETLKPLRLLQWHTLRCNRPQYFFRRLSLLLSRGLLPVGWLSTRGFQENWASVARNLSVPQGCRDAVDFLTAAMRHLWEPGTTAFSAPCTAGGSTLSPQRRTLIGILALISALSIYTNDRYAGAARRKTVATPSAASRQLAVIFHECLSRSRPQESRIDPVDRFALAVAAFVSFERAQVSAAVSDEVEGIIRKALSRFPGCPPQDRREYYDATSSLLSAIAENCTKGLRLSSHKYLSTIIDGLKTLEAAPGLLDTVATDSVFVLARRTRDTNDLHFAEDIGWEERQRRIESCEALPRVEAAPVLSGYRWEEGIGEWVTESPVRTRTRQQTRSVLSDWGMRTGGRDLRHERIKVNRLSRILPDSFDDCPDLEETASGNLVGQPSRCRPRVGSLLVKRAAWERREGGADVDLTSSAQGPKRRRSADVGFGCKFQRLAVGRRQSSGCESSDDELAL